MPRTPGTRQSANKQYPRAQIHAEFHARYNALQPQYQELVGRELFLKRFRFWDREIHANWVPRKILGRGGSGICVLFERKDARRHGTPKGIPRYVVLKQGMIGGWDANMKRESRFLYELGKGNPRHIIRMYTSHHRRPGTGTHQLYDPSPFRIDERTGREVFDAHSVARIYLEYCEEGDVATRIMKTPHRRPYIMKELTLWRILKCLALASFVLEYGHEDYKTENGKEPKRRMERSIIHLDLKAANILIQPTDIRDQTHPNGEIYKLTDFGLSEVVPDDITHPKWLHHSSWRSTRDSMPPEMLYPNHTNRKIGNKVDIWQVGLCIWHILACNFAAPPTETFIAKFHQNGTTRIIKTFFPELWGTKYSDCFKRTLWCCLAWDPDERPSARELLKWCDEAIAFAEGLEEGEGSLELEQRMKRLFNESRKLGVRWDGFERPVDIPLPQGERVEWKGERWNDREFWDKKVPDVDLLAVGAHKWKQRRKTENQQRLQKEAIVRESDDDVLWDQSSGGSNGNHREQDGPMDSGERKLRRRNWFVLPDSVISERKSPILSESSAGKK